MIDFFITEPNGRIVMTGQCPEDQLAIQKHQGMHVRVGKARIGLDYWDEAHGVVPLPPMPSATHKFDYVAKTWQPDVDAALALVRAERDALIAATDWRATRSIVEKRRLHPAWVEYRNALRDITLQPNPTNIVWPAVPTAPTFADEDPNEYPIFEGNSKFEIFTDAERASILSATQRDTQVMLLVNRITGATFITYEDPEMAAGLSYLVQADLLTQERKDAIVQLMLPPALRG